MNSFDMPRYGSRGGKCGQVGTMPSKENVGLEHHANSIAKCPRGQHTFNSICAYSICKFNFAIQFVLFPLYLIAIRNGLYFQQHYTYNTSPPFTSQLDMKKAFPKHLVNINDKTIRLQQSCFVYRATKWHSAVGSDIT